MDRRLSINTVNRKFVEGLLAKRMLKDYVVISKHFCDRFNERRIDPSNVKLGINKLASNICQIIYSFETGETPSININNISIKMKWNGKFLILTTCY